MLRLLISLIVLTQGFSSVLQPVPAKTLPGENRSATLCMPGVYTVDPQDCLPMGPSSFITTMASSGISFPLLALPYQPIDDSLSQVPFNYAYLGEEPTMVYASLEDAIVGKNPVSEISPGKLRFITYVDFADTDNGRFFKRLDDTWVRVSSRVSVPRSFPGGIELSRTPQNSFGWVLPFAPTVETRRLPGTDNKDLTGHIINQYQIVQVYSTKIVNGNVWYLIDPDEWVEGRFIGRVIPNVTPPDGVENGRWIEVNLEEQTLAVYEQGKLIYATLIATGLKPFFTRPGLFQIQRKLDSTPMYGAFEADRSDYYYLEDVPWTMYYDDARALHGAYWRTAFGFPQSHGCVNLSPGDAHWLFNWANEGDWVYVWDPSGKTPTDPAYYGKGGA